MSLPAYAEYKDSGVEWLGDVPKHWQVVRIKNLTPIKRGASPRPIENPIYFDDEGEYGWIRIADVTLSNGILFETPQKLSQLGSSLSVKLQPDSFFVSIAGSVGKPCVTKIKACIHDGFVYFPELKIPYQLLYRIFEQGLCFGGLGKMGTQLNLNTETIGEISIVLPPMNELHLVLDFLDHETAKIDALIAEQQRLIELLKEKRQAVISHAVTKGLDPNAPMKDSGVVWLGNVPEHWEVVTAKRISKVFVPQRNKPQLNTLGDGVYWVTMEDMKSSIIEKTNFCVSEDDIILASSKVLSKGSVISSCVGVFGVASINTTDVIINQQLQAFIPSDSVDPIFLFHCTRCAKGYFEHIATAATLLYVNQQGFENMPLAIPLVNEQKAIVDFLDQQTAKIDELISHAHQGIDLLKERRSALISAAVTGKIDVRGWQPPATAATTPQGQQQILFDD